MRCAFRDGTLMSKSTLPARSAPVSPVMPTIKARRARPASAPRSTLGLFPLVDIATTTSPAEASDSICRAKIFSKPRSFPAAVKIDAFVVSEIAANPARFFCRRTTSSAARCCASAALPPLPKKIILPPFCNAPAPVSANRAMRPSSSSEKFCLTLALSRNSSRICWRKSCTLTSYKAEQQHRKHQQRERHVRPVAFFEEREYAKRHARHGRRDKHHQSELNPIPAVPRDDSPHNSPKPIQARWFPLEHVVTRHQPAIFHQIKDSPGEHHNRRQNHTGAQQHRNDPVHPFVIPLILRLGHLQFPRQSFHEHLNSQHHNRHTEKNSQILRSRPRQNARANKRAG